MINGERTGQLRIKGTHKSIRKSRWDNFGIEMRYKLSLKGRCVMICKHKGSIKGSLKSHV